MGKIYLIIEVHQPIRLRTYRFSEIGNNNYYYDDYENEYYTKKISEEYYIPTNNTLLDLIQKFPGKLKISYLFSGVVLDQFALYSPETLKSFKSVINTGCVKLLSGSYSNSCGLEMGYKEFKEQRSLLQKRIRNLFRRNSAVFTDRDIFSSNPIDPEITLFFGNRKSNNYNSAGFSFNKNKKELLTISGLLKILNGGHKGNNDIAVLFVPYGISGGYQNTGLNEFLKSLPGELFSKSDYSFADPSEILKDLRSEKLTRNTSSFVVENFKTEYNSDSDLQKDAIEKLNSLQEKVKLCNDKVILKDWLFLQSCDHFYFMDPELYEEDKNSSLVTSYDSPFSAYLNYMNILADFSERINRNMVNKVKVRKVPMHRWNKALRKVPVRTILE